MEQHTTVEWRRAYKWEGVHQASKPEDLPGATIIHGFRVKSMEL